jgi:hypothetical protein
MQYLNRFIFFRFDVWSGESLQLIYAVLRIYRPHSGLFKCGSNGGSFKRCGTYWESKNWLFSDLSRWTIYHSYIFISPNLSDCCQVSKQAEIWPVQAEIIDHPVLRVSMFGPTELRWTAWRPTKLKNMVLALTSALNKGCAPARPNKVCTVGLRHVINALKISRVSAYHLCSTHARHYRTAMPLYDATR